MYAMPERMIMLLPLRPVLLMLLFLLAAPLQAAVSVDQVTTDNTNGNTSSLDFNHTVPSGSNRLLLIGVSIWNEDNEEVDSISYDNQSLTRLGAKDNGDDSRVEIWYLLNPPEGSAGVEIDFTSNVDNDRLAVAGALSLSGVDQSNPLDNMADNTGDSSTSSITLGSDTGDLVFALMAAEKQKDPPVADNSMTSQWSEKPGGSSERVAAAGASLAGASSVTFEWSLEDNEKWAVAAVSINPASSGSSGTVCQTFRDEFSSESYSRNDGTVNWSGNWIETGDNNNPSNGDIEISNNVLQLEGDGSFSDSNFGGPYITRTADLTSYSTAELSFSYSEDGNWEGNDEVAVYISTNNGSSWSLLKEFKNDQGSNWQTYTGDISAYAGNHVVLALVEGASDSNETFYFDDFQIEACSSGSGPSGGCSAYWPSGLQNTSNAGEIKFKDGGQMLNDPDNTVETTDLKFDNTSDSCNSQQCDDSNTVVTAINPGNFKSSSANTDVTKSAGQNFELGSDNRDEYDTIKLEKSNNTAAGTLTDSGSYTEYKIDKLDVEEGGSIVLRAGTDYWIDDLQIKNEVTLTVTGSGTARLFINSHTDFEQDTIINSPSAGNAGDASKLLIYVYDKLHIKDNATVSAIVYAEDEFDIRDSDSRLFGAAASAGKIEIDRGKVTFDSDAVSAITIDGICSGTTTNPPANTQADSFNCQHSSNKKLYTRIVDSAFNVDVVALNEQGNAEADFASESDRQVTVELVDVSGGGSCSTYPLVSGTPTLTPTFTSSDSGELTTANFTVDKAYTSVKCRVTDSNDSPAVVGCSSDSFAIRPAALTLTAPSLNNSGATGTPVAIAGDSFTLTVQGGSGYSGTPGIDTAQLEAHSGGSAGTLSGSFANTDSANGTAEGTFTYSEAGNFRLDADALTDENFTAVDQSSDCQNNSTSNTIGSNKKVGCNIGSAQSSWVGRFTPHHFVISNTVTGEFINSCVSGGFSYAGTDIGFATDPEILITAKNSSGDTTVNYHGAYASVDANSLNLTGISADALTSGLNGSVKVALDWTLGSQLLTENNDGTFTLSLSGDSFNYDVGGNNLAAAFNPSISPAVAVTDDDGITGSGSFSIDGTSAEVRYGRIAIDDGTGTETSNLSVNMQTEYYNGSGFVINTADSCSSLPFSQISLSDPDNSDSLQTTDTCVLNGSNCAGGAQSLAASSGDMAFTLKAPGTGKTGELNITVDVPVYLEYDWNGSGAENPSATVTFGSAAREQSLIFMRDVR